MALSHFPFRNRVGSCSHLAESVPAPPFIFRVCQHDSHIRGRLRWKALAQVLDEPSARSLAGETAVDRSLDTGVGLKASAKKDEVSLPQTGSFSADKPFFWRGSRQQAGPVGALNDLQFMAPLDLLGRPLVRVE